MIWEKKNRVYQIKRKKMIKVKEKLIKMESRKSLKIEKLIPQSRNFLKSQ